MSARPLIFIFVAVAVLVPASAQAYIDPGTGSLVVQGAIAAVVGLGLTIKLSWRRIRKALGGRGLTNEPSRDDGSDADA